MVASCKIPYVKIPTALCARGCVLVSSALLCNLVWVGACVRGDGDRADDRYCTAHNHVRTRQREFLHKEFYM